jgi:HPt (histidine-containing phosphotransfer) domain-containing protein
VPVLDRAVIEKLRALALATGPTLLSEIFQAFSHDCGQRLPRIREAQRTGDTKTLASAAHALKGASANVGACRVTELAQRLQALADTQTLSEAGPVIDELDREVDAALKEVAALGVNLDAVEAASGGTRA